MLKRWPETPPSIIAAIAPSLNDVTFAVSRAGPASVPVAGDRRKPRFCARRHIRSRRSTADISPVGVELRVANERPRIEGAVWVDVIAWWHRVWPPTAVAVAPIVDVAWVVLLGYGLAKLL
jgi:hypothetical protein